MDGQHPDALPAVELRRQRALRLQGESGHGALTALDELREDPDEAVRTFARRAIDRVLARMKSTPGQAVAAPVPGELRQALESPEGASRIAALRRATWFGAEDLVPILLQHLPRETDPSVVGYLVRAILVQRVASTFSTVAAYLEDDEPRVRAKAVEGLWLWKDRRVADAVARRLRDGNARVQAAAIVFAVAHTTTPSSPQLRNLLAHPAVWVRLAAVYGLSLVRASWAIQQVVRVAADSGQPAIVGELARDIAPGGLVDPVPAPRPGHGGAEDRTVRTDLTRHLPALSGAPDVAAALAADDALMRIHGLQNAQRFSTTQIEQAIDALAAGETDPMVVATLGSALAATRGASAVPILHGLLEHDDSRVRANALEALDRLGVDLEEGAISRLMADDTARVRVQAADYLFRRRPDDALPILRRMLLGEDDPVREAALMLICRLRDSRTLPLLEAALSDRRRHVCKGAHDILQGVVQDWTEAASLLAAYRRGEVAGEVIDGESIQALVATADSATPVDRMSAMRKLVLADDPNVEMMLELNLASRDRNVRAQAAHLLVRRHRERSLPRLQTELGRKYLDLSARGHALIPEALDRELQRLIQSFIVESATKLSPDDQLGLVARRIGEELCAAYERDEPFDELLRSHCREVRALCEQIAQYAPGATGRRTTAPSEPPNTPGDVERAEEVGPASVEASRDALSGRVLTGLAIVAFYLGSLYVTVMLVRPAAPAAPGHASNRSPDGTDRELLDRMSLEDDAVRFRERYAGRSLSFTARVRDIRERTLQVQSGTLRLRVTIGKAERLADRSSIGKRISFVGTVEGVDPDLTVQVGSARMGTAAGHL